MNRRTTTIVAGLAVAAAGLLLLPASALAQADAWEVPRMADGHPDLSGTYNTATLTPLSRPSQFGDNLYLTEEEANEVAEAERLRTEARSQIVGYPRSPRPPQPITWLQFRGCFAKAGSRPSF